MMRPLALRLVLLLLGSAASAQTMTPFGNQLQLSVQDESAFLESHTTDAANENAQLVGTIVMQAGSGTKTISAAGGGAMYVCVQAATFTTASSELRVGIEDVDANGVGDGTQDVYSARVAGTDTITATQCASWAMTSGTKTLTHGDRVSLSVRMPVRAGADSVVWHTWASRVLYTTSGVGTGRPYGVLNGTKGPEMFWALVEFDDTTYGWVQGTRYVNPYSSVAITFNNTDVLDEYIGTFTCPSPVQLGWIGWVVDNAATGDTFELVLYSDPYGTPSAVQTATISPLPDAFIGTADSTVGAFITPTTCAVGTTYGVALRPTTANDITLYHTTLGAVAGVDPIKRTIPFLGAVKFAARANQTGAFTEVQTYFVPLIFVGITGLPDGTGGASEHSSVH